MEGLKGRLLVATPLLGDPNFERTVVLVLEHGGEGALGVVLNRPSALDVAEPLPEWSAFAGEPDVVFVGGPVSRSSVIALAHLAGVGDGDRTDVPTGAWEPVVGSVGVLDLARDPALLAGTVGGVRVFAGYAGWGPGQLEGEIAEGAWYVVDAEAADAFTGDPEHLWQRVLARQPGDIARVALVPADPSVN